MTPPLLDFAHLESISTAWANTMIAVSWKAMVLLAVAGLTTFLLRRRAAAARHLVWNASVLAVLCLPALALMVPAVQVDTLADWTLDPQGDPSEISPAASGLGWRSAPIAAAPASTYRLVSVDDTSPVVASRIAPALTELREVSPQREGWATSLRALVRSARDWSAKSWALLGWELGALLVLLWFALGNWRVRRLRRGCIENRDPEMQAELEEAAAAVGLSRVPRLLWTRHAYTPLTLGTWRAQLILPTSARDWSARQRREVLLHELAHVQRRDVFTQGLAQLACALFWFHPLPWIAAGRMRLERERACDDRVLMAGSRASTYASHLLEMARSLHFESALSTASVAMARRSQLGERMESLLDRRPRGRSMGRTARAFVIAATLGLALPLAAMRPAVDAPAKPAKPEVNVVELAAPQVRTGNFFSRDDHHFFGVTSDGQIRFAPSKRAIEWMEDGATFEIDWRDFDGGESRRVEFDGKGDEGFDTRYFVGSESAQFDDAAREWFAQTLQEYLDRRSTGRGVRVGRPLAPKPAQEAVTHLERLDRSRALGFATQARALHVETAAERRDLAETLAALEGQSEISSETLAAALATADGFSSDSMKVRILGALIPYVAGDSDREELFYRVADELQSDAQYQTLLLRLRMAGQS